MTENHGQLAFCGEQGSMEDSNASFDNTDQRWIKGQLTDARSVGGNIWRNM